MAEQNHYVEEAYSHIEAPTPPSSSPQPDNEKLNELSPSQPVHEQRDSKEPEMAMTEEGREESLFGSDGGFEYTDSPGISQIEFELELSALIAAFWFFDSDTDEQTEPLVGFSIMKGISRMVGWIDGGKKKSRQESD